MSEKIKNLISNEGMRMIIAICTVVISIMLFFGAMDKRVTTLETEMQYKVDERRLYERLDKLQEDINNKIENEFKKQR